MINPTVLILGLGSFLGSFLIHVFAWRIIKPARQLVWLVSIFIILPVVVYILVFWLSRVSIAHSRHFIASGPNLIFIILWHIVLSCAYIMSYSPIQVPAPSLKIILAVSASGSEGMTSESIHNLFSEDTLLLDRIDDLIDDRLVFLRDGKLVISRKGRLVAAFFSSYRNLLDLPLGEG